MNEGRKATPAVWRHARADELHTAVPSLTQRSVQPGTGATEAPCLVPGCGETVFCAPEREATAHAPICRWYEQAPDGSQSCDCGAAGRKATGNLPPWCGDGNDHVAHEILDPLHGLQECAGRGPARAGRATTQSGDAASNEIATTPQGEGQVAAAAFYQGERVFVRIGNYEFEVVVPPLLREFGDPVEAARSTADLLERQLDLLRATAGEQR